MLLAQGMYSFLANLSQALHSKDMLIMGNTNYALPHLQLASIFDIAGIETNWKFQGTFAPDARLWLSYKRAMAYARPYIFLQNTDFDVWTYNDTLSYHDICLSVGIWASFFSANAASNQYFQNPAWYNRDRPIFEQYVPVLRAMSAAGWQPVTNASLVASAPSAGVLNAVPGLYIERFGGLLGGQETVFFLTVRCEGCGVAASSASLSVGVSAAPARAASIVVQDTLRSGQIVVLSQDATGSVVLSLCSSQCDFESLGSDATRVFEFRVQ